MPVNEDVKQSILEYLKVHYPSHGPKFQSQPFAQHPDFVATLAYLHQQKLIDWHDPRGLGNPRDVVNVKLTAEGYDELLPDGGLTAKRRTVVIKLDAENLRGILSDRIIAMHLKGEDERSALAKLRDVPEEVLAEAGADLLKEAIKSLDFKKVLAVLRTIGIAIGVS